MFAPASLSLLRVVCFSPRLWHICLLLRQVVPVEALARRALGDGSAAAPEQMSPQGTAQFVQSVAHASRGLNGIGSGDGEGGGESEGGDVEGDGEGLVGVATTVRCRSGEGTI